jgi:hypothetical protein
VALMVLTNDFGILEAILFISSFLDKTLEGIAPHSLPLFKTFKIQ